MMPEPKVGPQLSGVIHMRSPASAAGTVLRLTIATRSAGGVCPSSW